MQCVVRCAAVPRSEGVELQGIQVRAKKTQRTSTWKLRALIGAIFNLSMLLLEFPMTSDSVHMTVELADAVRTTGTS